MMCLIVISRNHRVLSPSFPIYIEDSCIYPVPYEFNLTWSTRLLGQSMTKIVWVGPLIKCIVFTLPSFQTFLHISTIFLVLQYSVDQIGWLDFNPEFGTLSMSLDTGNNVISLCLLSFWHKIYEKTC